jgi:PAS domain S-box-containing protein
MAEETILVVEDNDIVAKDIRRRVETLGYQVSGTARTAEQAVQKALEGQPDLVLMDIKLRGPTDGIEAAEAIREHLDVPVVYLTAYADDETIERAKVSGPFGYIVKPFEENVLRSSIEIALFKHKMEKALRESRQSLATTLKCMAEGTIATDAGGRVRLMNPAAESLTGWNEEEVLGRPWEDVLALVDEKTGRPAQAAVKEAIEAGQVTTSSNRTCLIDRMGSETPVEVISAPIINDAGERDGAVLLFKDVSVRKVAEETLQQNSSLLKAALDGVSDPVFLRSLDGLLVLVNAAAARLLGRPEKNLLGKDAATLFGPRSAALMDEAHERALARREAQTFECRVPVNGEERAFQISEQACFDKDGQLAGVVAVLREIDESPRGPRGTRRAKTLAVPGTFMDELSRGLDDVRDGFQKLRAAWRAGAPPGALVKEIENQISRLSRILDEMSEPRNRRRNRPRSD